ncbi:MAG: DUF934 domain-containing protein [Stagnimonas sp.]|nr:DUF934 domain-containing protein [Stagnimonas sp.]
MSLLLDRLGQRIPDLYPEWTEPGTPPPGQPRLLTLERFMEEGAPAAAAVLLPNTANVLSLPASVLACPLLVLDYPAFADGRAYSQARLLSRNGRYSGELRARGGAVVYDQLRMLKICCFTQFLLRADQDDEACSLLLSSTATR